MVAGSPVELDILVQAEKAGDASLMEYEQLRLESQRLGDRWEEMKHSLDHLKVNLERNVHVWTPAPLSKSQDLGFPL